MEEFCPCLFSEFGLLLQESEFCLSEFSKFGGEKKPDFGLKVYYK